MAKKRPAFQFYPGDWRRDLSLQSCSLMARGLWFEIMCLAHDGKPYGHLKVNGHAIKVEQLARMVGEGLDNVRAGLAELENAGVFSRADDGTIYSRRMVRDEKTREARRLAGLKGGNPALLNQGDNPRDKQSVADADANAESKGGGAGGGKPKPWEDEAWPGHALVKLWFEGHPYFAGNGGRVTEPVRKRVVKAVDGLLRLDERDPEQVFLMFRWIFRDAPRGDWQGWAAVMRNPQKLRELSKDGISRYWDVIKDQMDNPRKPSGGGRRHEPTMEELRRSWEGE